MKKQKVAIIGAGICGLYLAWKLSEKGHKAWIFEKKKKIGQEVCSGLISQRILEFIPHLSCATFSNFDAEGVKHKKGTGFIPESPKLIKNQINFAFLHFPQKTIKLRFSKDFFVISHFELDRLTANLAIKAGAKIILNHDMSSIPEGFDKVIGCDGAGSFVRRNLGLPDPGFRMGIQGFVEQKTFENYVETWPCEKGGFIWKIPRGNEIEYGIITKPQEAKKLFDSFLEKNKISLKEKKSRIIPQGFLIPANPLVTLCGDAAGLTKPWSGGGIIWGLTAAEMLLNAFPDFLSYRKLMKRFFLPKIILSKNISKLIYFLGYKMPWLLPSKNKIESDFLI